MSIFKMNTLLAKVEHTTKTVRKMLQDQKAYFSHKQGAFRGERKTFVPRDGYAEVESKMGTISVATTVDEQFDWFFEQFKQWLADTFSVEATNSGDAAKVELKVGDKSFGNVTALDLMRLKTILTDSDLDGVFMNIPVRSDSVVWEKTTDPEYAGRAVFQTKMISGVTHTTETEEIVLKDPNLDPQHLPANYRAITSARRKTVDTGDYTSQNFTGEWTQRQKAELLKRRSELLEAVIKALKEVNDIEVKQPNLDIDAFVDYIYKG